MLITFNEKGEVGQTAPTPAEAHLGQIKEVMEAAGQRYMVFGTDVSDIYVIDPLTEHARPGLRPRLPGEFDKTELAPGEIATFPDLPACEVSVFGPGVQGTTPHPGGPWQVRFLIPGEYILAVEPFPARRREFRFTINTGAAA